MEGERLNACKYTSVTIGCVIALPYCKCDHYTLGYTLGRLLDVKVAPKMELNSIVSAVGVGEGGGSVVVCISVCVCACLRVCSALPSTPHPLSFSIALNPQPPFL